MKIHELIQLQERILGDKWLEAIGNPQKAAKMVDMIADHLAESMKKAYEQGMIEGIEIKSLPREQLNMLLRK